jgi:hypothetical protein
MPVMRHAAALVVSHVCRRAAGTELFRRDDRRGGFYNRHKRGITITLVHRRPLLRKGAMRYSTISALHQPSCIA